MPERQPRKSRTFPSPFQLAFLIIVIAVGTLSAVLLSFGGLGNFLTSPSVIKQAQAVESPTNGTVEATTEIPTSDLAATLKPSATLFVTETATLEPSPTLTETVVVETPTVSVEPTQTEIPVTKIPRVTPTTTVGPSPTLVLVTNTPLAKNGTIVFESAGNLFLQSIDSQGNAIDGIKMLETGKSADETITAMIPSPDGRYVLLFIQTADKEGERLVVASPSSNATQPLLNDEQLGQDTKVFGWNSNSREIVYWDGENIWLLDKDSGDKHFLTNPQTWANLPYPPLVDSVAFSPDGKRLIASYSTSGQDGRVWILDADGSNPRAIFKEDYRISAFSWSPNGNLIAFVGNGVEIMDKEGSSRKAIGERFIGGKAPAWSPDNRFIAYTADFHPNYKINIVDVETGQQTYIGSESISAVLPDWSPDGSYVIFLHDWSDSKGAKAIWIASSDGTVSYPFNENDQPKRVNPLWISQ